MFHFYAVQKLHFLLWRHHICEILPSYHGSSAPEGPGCQKKIIKSHLRSQYPAALPLGFLLGSEHVVITSLCTPLHLNSRSVLAVIISSNVIKFSAVIIMQEQLAQLS